MANNTTRTRKTLIIVAAAILVAGIGFGAGMIAKESLATESSIEVSEAKSIALSHAGVSEDKATFTKTKLDDDGYYDVEFYTDSTEYDFEIDAQTGKILEKDSEPRELGFIKEQASNNAGSSVVQQSQTEGYSTVSGSDSNSFVIGVDAAKRAALNHAGVSNATFVKAYLDYDDGLRVYEIEFTAGSYEYEYEINAVSGAILDWDKDLIDYDDDN